jgi:signal transduction histidine kinase
LLGAGFTLVILLLLADAFIGFYSIRSIQTAACALADDQLTQMALVDEVQREQGSLSAIFYLLAGDPDSLDRSKILAQIEATERNLKATLKKVPDDPLERTIWTQLASASSAFANEARRMLAFDDPPTFQSSELLRRHDEVRNTVSALIRLTHMRARNAKERIEVLANAQVRRNLLLLGGSVLLAFACAFLVMRTSTNLYQRIADQSDQLTRVSWQLLDNQEMVARRLSHELHDELGQALTALKTNFTRHANSGFADAAWIEDCSNLLRDSIRSAHEISQLLRPTILDDFGLTSALNWLCERFEERTEIDVQYSSTFEGRLAPETETHLFRIAQEALTNAARHAEASLVTVRLHQDTKNVYLSIEDNGKGLPPPGEVRKGALGLIGMRARAQSSKGELTIQSSAGQGTSIQVFVPLAVTMDEEKDPHPVG